MVTRIALSGLVAALAVVLTYLMSVVPNVELTSLTIFLGGRLVGPTMGMATGVVSALCFSITNPLGPPDPLLLAAQCLGYAGWGLLGGMSSRLGLDRSRVVLAMAAALQTLVFQVLVNTSFCLVYGWGVRETVLMALPYVAIHVASNLAFFALLVPVLEARLGHLARRLDVELAPQPSGS